MSSLSAAVTWSPPALVPLPPSPTPPLLLPDPFLFLYANGTSSDIIAGDLPDPLGVAGPPGKWMSGPPDSASMASHRVGNSSDPWVTSPCSAEGNDTSCGNSSSSSAPTFACNVDQPGLYYFTQVWFSLVCLIGLGGNTLVIYVVLRYSKMQTVTNMYIVNLAVADECFLIGIPFLLTTMNMQLWPFGNSLCKLYMATTSINQFTSSIFLTIMSADRYVAVCHPISAPCVRTPFVSKVVSCAAWSASALLMIPIFMYTTTMDNSCNILWPEGDLVSGQTAFTLYSFVLGFFLPLMLIFVFYYLVIRRLRTVGPRHQQKKHAEASKSGNISADVNSTISTAGGGGSSGEQRRRSHRKVTRLVLTVIAVYVFCWLPYWVTQLTLIFTPPKQCQSRLWVTIFLIAGCLSYSNSAVNPVLYAFLSDNFKKSFVKACTCKARSDINAALHLENSVFPRRNRKKKRSQIQRRSLPMSSGNQPTATALAPYDGATEGHTHGGGPAISEGGFLGVESDGAGWRGARLSSIEPSTAITMASRSNASAEAREEDEEEEEAVDVV